MNGKPVCALICVGLLAPVMVSAGPLDRYSVPTQESATDGQPPSKVSADVFENFKLALESYDAGAKHTLLKQLEEKRKDMLDKKNIKAAKYYNALIRILRKDLAENQ